MNVLFVCNQNQNRSKTAEEFANLILLPGLADRGCAVHRRDQGDNGQMCSLTRGQGPGTRGRGLASVSSDP